MNKCFRVLVALGLAVTAVAAQAQTYPKGLLDKTIAVVGNEMVSISSLEQEIQINRMNSPLSSDKNLRCEVLERMLETKLFLMQARIDSLKVNDDMVNTNLNMRIDQVRSQLGGDEEAEKYFGKPLHKLRQEWRKALEEQSLFQQEQGQIAGSVPEITPSDVREYLAKTDSVDLPQAQPDLRLS